MAIPRNIIISVLSGLLVSVVAIASVGCLKTADPKLHSVLVKAPVGPFKIPVAKLPAPYAGYRVFDRLPSGRQTPEIINFAPEPELPIRRR